MKTAIKYLIFFAIVIAYSIVSNGYLQPLLDNTTWSFFPISHIIVVPIFYFLICNTGNSKKYPPMKAWLIAVIAVLLYTCLFDLFKWDRIYGKLLATVVGAVFTFVYAYVQHKKSITN